MLINSYRFGVTDPSFASVSLLLHGSGTDGSTTIIDSSPSPKTVTAVGNAQISTAIADPFGNNTRGVLLFDATGDYLSVVSGTADFAFGTGDFTIELWLRLNAVVGTSSALSLYDQRPQGVQNDSPVIYIQNSTLGGGLTYYTGNANRIVGPALLANTWYFITLSKATGNTRLFLNGTQFGSTYVDTISYVNSANRPWIGGFSDNATPSTQATINGRICELRVTKGVARYTANFTPPTAPFPDS